MHILNYYFSAGSEDEEIEKWNVEENRVRLEECILDDEEKNGEPTLELDEHSETTESQGDEKGNDDIGNNAENDESEDFIDFKKGPTQLLKSDMLNSSMKSDFDKKVFYLCLL